MVAWCSRRVEECRAPTALSTNRSAAKCPSWTPHHRLRCNVRVAAQDQPPLSLQNVAPVIGAKTSRPASSNRFRLSPPSPVGARHTVISTPFVALGLTHPVANHPSTAPKLVCQLPIRATRPYQINRLAPVLWHTRWMSRCHGNTSYAQSEGIEKSGSTPPPAGLGAMPYGYSSGTKVWSLIGGRTYAPASVRRGSSIGSGVRSS